MCLRLFEKLVNALKGALDDGRRNGLYGRIGGKTALGEENIGVYARKRHPIIAVGIAFLRVIFDVYVFGQQKEGIFGQVIGLSAAFQRSLPVGDELQNVSLVRAFVAMAGLCLNARVVDPYVHRFEKMIVESDAVETAALFEGGSDFDCIFRVFRAF